MNNIKECSRSSADKEQKRCWLLVWEDGREHPRMLIVLERKCLDLSEATEQVSEKQELLATLMESKKTKKSLRKSP